MIGTGYLLVHLWRGEHCHRLCLDSSPELHRPSPSDAYRPEMDGHQLFWLAVTVSVL